MRISLTDSEQPLAPHYLRQPPARQLGQHVAVEEHPEDHSLVIIIIIITIYHNRHHHQSINIHHYDHYHLLLLIPVEDPRLGHVHYGHGQIHAHGVHVDEAEKS